MTTIQKITNRLRPYMKNHDYQFSKKCFYRIQNDIAYCIQFDMPSSLIYATFFAMPLYIPCEHRYYTYGKRISALPLLPRDASDKEIEKWCEALCGELGNRVFPFFQRAAAPEQLVDAVEEKQYILCPAVYISRLELFSYLYIGDFSKLLLVLDEYPRVLRSTTFLTETVRGHYMREAENVRRLMLRGEQECHTFCAETIEYTMHKCF